MPPMMPPGPPQGAGTPPFNQEPGPQGPVAGRVILDLATLPPQLIQILISLGVIDPNGMPMGGDMNMMEADSQLPGDDAAQGQSDPRVEAIRRAIGAGRAQVPSGY